MLLIIYWYSSSSCNINLDQLFGQIDNLWRKEKCSFNRCMSCRTESHSLYKIVKKKENSWKMVSLRYFPVSVGCILTYNYVWMKDVKLNLTSTNISFPVTVNMLFCILYVWWMIWHFCCPHTVYKICPYNILVQLLSNFV